MAFPRIVVPAPFTVSVFVTLGALAIVPERVNVWLVSTVTVALSFRFTGVVIWFWLPVPAVAVTVAPRLLLSNVRV